MNLKKGHFLPKRIVLFLLKSAEVRHIYDFFSKNFYCGKLYIK